MTPRIEQYAAEAAIKHGTAPARFIPAYAVCRGDAAARAARKEVMCRLRADGFTLKQIGRWLGIDHTTVIYWTSPGRKGRAPRTAKAFPAPERGPTI